LVSLRFLSILNFALFLSTITVLHSTLKLRHNRHLKSKCTDFLHETRRPGGRHFTIKSFYLHTLLVLVVICQTELIVCRHFFRIIFYAFHLTCTGRLRNVKIHVFDSNTTQTVSLGYNTYTLDLTDRNQLVDLIALQTNFYGGLFWNSLNFPWSKTLLMTFFTY